MTLDVIDVLLAYQEAAWWSSNSETDERGGEPLDDYMAENSTEPTPELVSQMREDVEVFLRKCAEAGLDLSECDAAQVGHDLWLTRNRHGVGFWDRDKGTYGSAETRDALDAIARDMGEFHLIVNVQDNTVEAA